MCNCGGGVVSYAPVHPVKDDENWLVVDPSTVPAVWIRPVGTATITYGRTGVPYMITPNKEKVLLRMRQQDLDYYTQLGDARAPTAQEIADWQAAHP